MEIVICYQNGIGGILKRNGAGCWVVEVLDSAASGSAFACTPLIRILFE